MNHCSRITALLLCAILLPLCSASITAQPLLDFRRIEVQYPKVSLAFRVTCGGTWRRDLGPQHFEVRENGILMKDVTVWCPPEDECCVSVSLVFDRSGSMLGTKLAKVKIGGLAFVDQMNPDGRPCDESSIVSFREFYTVDVGMTTNKNTLRNAINNMVAYGNTAVWDATAEGIRQLVSSAHNRCKAVVLLSDGGDNSSVTFPDVQDVIPLALANEVKVFTIGYGLKPGGKEEADLKALALSTGGTYFFSANGDDIAQFYATIKSQIKEAYKECEISYTSGCPDGQLRVVELTLKNYCNTTSTSATKTYVAPLDQSKFQHVQITLGSATAMGTQEVVVPVYLNTPVHGIFSKGEFYVLYDRRYAQMVGVSATGALLDSLPLTMRDIGSGHVITIGANKELDGDGILCYLRFKLADVATQQLLTLWLSNWTMDAYCLIPELVNGTITITPREAILACEATAPASIAWDDDKRDYVPNPITVSVEVRNDGTREARNVRARIIAPPTVFALVSPAVDMQYAKPSTVQPNSSASAFWTLRTLKQEHSGTYQICFEITSDNHPTITCCRDVTIAMTKAPALVCTLSAPDTVYFREQFYEPELFDVHLDAVNTGSGQARSVYGQLLQDTRFTIESDARIALADVMLPVAHAAGTFRVRMHPRTTDGYDTLRVNIQGEDTDPAWCERPVFVQRVRAPRFSLTCTTPDDSLAFSDVTGDYTPNPFPVTTTAVNTGETYAEECQLMFVGPPRFTPVGTNLRPLGTMQVNDARSEQWLVRALPRAVGGWDTLHFQVLGKGGLGRQIVVADCFLPVYVPPMRAPQYVLSCSAPDSLLFNRGMYVPDPFVFSVRISNRGTAAGRGLRHAIMLSPGVMLAASESTVKRIDLLVAGADTTVTWMLEPLLHSAGASEHLCARIADSSGLTDECCRDLFIPFATAPDLRLSCMAIDSLPIDPVSGAYLGNPFTITLSITNAGTATAENVTAGITPFGPAVQVLDPVNTTVGDLAPGASKDVSWRVLAQSRTTAADVPFDLRARADNHAERACVRTVHLPARREPLLAPACASQPEDSLFFDWNTGEFNPPDVLVTLRIRNAGGARATGVSGLLVIPEGAVLAAGETPLKSAVPSMLSPGEEASVQWHVQMLRNDAAVLRQFRFTARCDNAREAECTDVLWVEGSPRACTLWLPTDVLLKYGQKEAIPLSIDRTVGKDLASYQLDLRWDPSVISINGARSEHTLTMLGWTGPRLQPKEPGRAFLTDYTTTSPLHADSGVLVMLDIEGVYRAPGGGNGFSSTTLRVEQSTSLLNNGGVSLTTNDGRVFVTSDCLTPLVAAGTPTLSQNRPNPFNPTTIISYSLPAAGHVRLTILDPVGREVMLAEDADREAGAHDVRVDASSLRSGLYFYRLETQHAALMRAMLVAR